MVMQEFQAIVLAAGRGTRLPELLRNAPKCLLPIGPYPLLWYPLNLLQQHKFQEVTVIVLENEKVDIQLALEPTPLKLKLDFATIPADSDFGTADSLRYIHERIKADPLIISCDLVTNISLYPLINKFREHDASLVSLLYRSGFEVGYMVPGPKSKQKAERELIAIHPDTRRLLYMASSSDFEEVVPMNGHLMRKNQHMIMYSRMNDSHIYLMKKWTLDFIKKMDNFSSLKGEFVPFLLKKQMGKPNIQDTLYEGVDGDNVETGANHSTAPVPVIAETHSDLIRASNAKNSIFNYVPHVASERQLHKMTLFNDNKSCPLYQDDLLRCYALEAPQDSIVVRVNNILSLYTINQKLANIWSILLTNQGLSVDQQQQQQQQYTLISPQCANNCTQAKDIAAAANSKLSEKTSLNGSVFGANCSIQAKNIITKSLVMANATVEQGCNIENCIIGPNVLVKRGSKLKNCLVGASFVVDECSILESKHLTHADAFMEIDIP